jgi:hypothetical protein
VRRRWPRDDGRAEDVRRELCAERGHHRDWAAQPTTAHAGPAQAGAHSHYTDGSELEASGRRASKLRSDRRTASSTHHWSRGVRCRWCASWITGRRTAIAPGNGRGSRPRPAATAASGRA